MVPSAKGTKRARARLVGNARLGASHAASADETGTHAPTRVDGARPPYRPSSPSSRETNAKPAEGSNRGGSVTPFRNPEPYSQSTAPPPTGAAAGATTTRVSGVSLRFAAAAAP